MSSAEGTEVVYATGNPGKIFEVSRHLEPYGITVRAPGDFGITADVEETGETLEENSLLKARAFHTALPDKIIMSDDTGLEIDALDGEPGVFVRRWKDHKTEMTDAEIIEYALERLADIPAGQRGAQFRTVITLIWPDDREQQVDGILRGEIALEPAPFHIPGMPFEGLFYVEEWGKLLVETRQMSQEEKARFLSHRERAVEEAVKVLRERQ